MSAPVSECFAWATYDDLPCEVTELHTPDAWCGYLAMATDILWAATGRRWRGENLTETAILRAAPPRPGEGSWPYHSSWGRCACYGGLTSAGYPWWRRGPYMHHTPAAIRLPRPDVTEVVTVTIDTALFDDWALDGSWLVRTDGRNWPVCGERSIVTYRFGRTPPAAGRAAVLELATELGRATSTSPDRPCQLPKRLQSVTRQGISFAVLDNLDFLDKGFTGLIGVDAWIRAVNPKGRIQEATVWSPDLPRARRSS